MNNIPFWDTVVTNAAPIIIATTGLLTTLGGFWFQYHMMKMQNQKIDQHAKEAADARTAIQQDITEIKNGH